MVASHLHYRKVVYAEARFAANPKRCARESPSQAAAAEAFRAAQRSRQRSQPARASPAGASPTTGAAAASATGPAPPAAPPSALSSLRRRHNVSLILSSQRCGSNWISRMIRGLGVRPFGQESLLDFCTNSRSPKYATLDRCVLPNGACNQCNRDGDFSPDQKRAYCDVAAYRRCVDPLLGWGPEQGRGKNGFLVKYDHFSFAPRGALLEYFKSRGVGFIHVTRDPLFVFLSLKDNSYKNKHGGSYAKHEVNLVEFGAYHRQYMAWATEWAALLEAHSVETLDLSYESLSGRDSWKAWNQVTGAGGFGEGENSRL